MTSTPSTPDPVKPLVEATSQVPEQGTSETSPRKSKRLSSLVWIAVLWVFVRLIAETNGLGWERAFWKAAFVFGALPASVSLALAAISGEVKTQKYLRWFALLAVLFSFLGFAIASIQLTERIANGYLRSTQEILATLPIAGYLYQWITTLRGRR